MTTPQSLPAWLYTDPRFFELEREKVFRAGLAHHGPRQRRAEHRRLSHARHPRRTRRHRARRGRQAAQLPQCLPPPRRQDRAANRAARAAIASSAPITPGATSSTAASPARRNGRALRISTPRRYGLQAGRAGDRHGFIFVRFATGLPSVAEMMAPYADELAALRAGEARAQRPRHAAPAPGELEERRRQLFRRHAHPRRPSRPHRASSAGTYQDRSEGVDRQDVGRHQPRRRRTIGPSAHYQKLLDGFDHIPAERRRLWAYYKLWPNVAFDIYPDQVDFMQFIPVSPTRR